MSSNDKYFAIGLVGIVAIFGSVALELAQAAAPAPQEVVKLERVVIEGRRTLPTDGVQVAAAKAPVKAI